MKKILVVALLLVIGTMPGYSQRISRVMSGIDIGTGYAEQQWGPSFLYFQALDFPKAPWLQVNGGVRVWSYFANDVNLTAPSGAKQSDMMQLDRVTATGANFVLGVNLRLAKVVDIGVNADMLGIAFGKRRNAIYRLGSVASATDSIQILDGTEIGIAPTNLNIVPYFISKNNGQAEAFVRFWINQRFGFKVSYVLGQVAYRSDNKLNNGQRRFSSTYQMPYFSLSFPLYN